MLSDADASWSRDEAKPHFLVRLVRRLRPWEGYAVLGLAWAAVVSLPAAAVQGGLIAGLGSAPGLATAALLLAWWLAHRRLRGYLGALLLALAGGVAVLGWGVHVLAPRPLLGQGGRWLAWWLGQRALPAPPLDAFGVQAEALARFWHRVGWWVAGLTTGRGGVDNLVVIGFASLAAWAVAAWAGWWLARHGRPFVALLPTGILLANQVYWSSQSYWTLLAFLGGLTGLLVWLPVQRQIRAWERAQVDYSPEIRLDAAFIALGIGSLVLILAPTLPFLTSQELSRAFWRLFENPYRQVEQRVEASFVVARPGRSLIPPSGVAPGGLPRAHLLGGRPELGQEVALRVAVREAGPGERFYWRGQTFARYTGRGWEDDGPAATRAAFDAGAPWLSTAGLASRRSVLVAVTTVAASRAVLYAPAEPVSVDHPYRAIERAPGSLVALTAAGSPQQYAVLSAAPQVDANRLRGAGAAYDPAVADVYLQLPPDLPVELAAYAAELAAAAPPTPYDRAVAIEAALRKIPYTLDVPRPPPDREVVSWFLFDLQRGYCDYFATAMVVLARLNGIPARLAVGYATGSYDEGAGEYVVTERQAHSWPELYFPGYGWISFEPTPAQPLPPRTELAAALPPPAGRMPVDMEAGMTELRALATVQAAARSRRSAVQGVLGALSVLLAGWLVSQIGAQRRPAPLAGAAGEAAEAYGRLIRWGGRLGRPVRPADTPREYAAALAAAAVSAAGRARWGRRGADRAAGIVGTDAAALAELYEAAAYGSDALRGAAARAANSGRWARLWMALGRLRLARIAPGPAARPPSRRR